jgi:gluconate 2-dehydrogenase subunit 3-like protein
MKRRVALKQILIGAAASAILPSCFYNKKEKKSDSLVSLSNFSITEEQQQTVAAVCGSLIPETEIVGAEAIAAHLFVLKMVDDCYNKKTQDAFVKGIDQLNEIANKSIGNPFAESPRNEREQLLRKVDTKEINSPDLLEFFQLTKQHTIQAFMTCEYVMTKIKGFELVPGRFKGCIQL